MCNERLKVRRLATAAAPFLDSQTHYLYVVKLAGRLKANSINFQRMVLPRVI